MEGNTFDLSPIPWKQISADSNTATYRQSGLGLREPTLQIDKTFTGFQTSASRRGGL